MLSVESEVLQVTLNYETQVSVSYSNTLDMSHMEISLEMLRQR
jgi:hypothetical protein